jgi:predicted porin
MIKILRRTKLSAALCVAGIGLMAANQASAEVTYKFSGYGTLAATMTDDDQMEFRSSLNQSKGAGSQPDIGVDSRLGVQGVVNFGSGLSVNAQLLGQRRRTDTTATSNSDFDVGFEWLFGQYSPTSNIDLRLGRVVLPAFMISDSRNVGYTQPWLRAPMSVYAGMPLTTLDGAQALWRIPMGPVILSIQPSYGESAFNISSGALVLKSTSHPVMSLNGSLEFGDWQVRAGQVRGTSQLTGLVLNPALAGFPLDHKMKDVFTSAGLQYDNGTAVLMTEWTQRKQNDIDPSYFPGFGIGGKPLAEGRAWYVAGGWRFGKWLPMLSYGENKNTLTSDKTHNTSLSLRYDVMTNVALKAQVSRYDAKDGAAFVQDDITKSTVNVFAIGVDFVF